MKIKNFNLIIVLMAEILVAIYGYVYHYSLFRLTVTMAVVFALFFVIGSLLQMMSNRLFAEVEAREQREREEEEERQKAEKAKEKEEAAEPEESEQE